VGILTIIATVLLVLVCIALIGLILIQRGKGGGLAGVFGGGGMEQAFGTHAASMAQKATAVLGVIFLVLTILLGILKSGRGVQSAPGATAPSQSAPVPEAPAGGAPAVPEVPPL
jgi:preprotein translocase subunit SecG